MLMGYISSEKSEFDTPANWKGNHGISGEEN